MYLSILPTFVHRNSCIVTGEMFLCSFRSFGLSEMGDYGPVKKDELFLNVSEHLISRRKTGFGICFLVVVQSDFVIV